jgi:hypothetical protein
MLDQLPVEILIEIFEQLDFVDLLNVSRCCKKFFDVTNFTKFTDKFLLKLQDGKNFEEFQEAFRNPKRSYRNLSIEKLDWNWDLQMQSGFAENIVYLDLSSMRIASLTDFFKFMVDFKNIEHVRLECLEMIDCSTGIQMMKFKNLKFIELLYASNNLMEIFKETGNSLEVLKLCLVFEREDSRKNYYYDFIKNLLIRNRQTMKTLHLHEVYFDDLFLDLISDIDFSSLKDFGMSYNEFLSTTNSNGLEKFLKKNSKNIQIFKLNTFSRMTNKTFQLVIDHLKNLKGLNMIAYSHYDYNIKNFHQLKFLDTLEIHPSNLLQASNSYNQLIANQIMKHQNLNMKKLTLMSFDMNERVVKNIIDKFPNLTYLNLSYGCKFKTEYFHILISNLKRLRKIVLEDCKFLDNPNTILMEIRYARLFPRIHSKFK